MTKKIFTVVFFCLVSVLLSIGQNESKNIYGISLGFSPAREDGMYLGGQLDTWPDKKLSAVVNLFYARELTKSFRIGTYFEYENAKFDNWNFNSQKASRYNLGINWLGQYPKTAFKIQLGGYAGGGYVNSDFTGWEKPLWGFDLGAIMGPAFETENIGFAIHAKSGFAWYHGSTQPESVILMLPKFLFKVYYKL